MVFRMAGTVAMALADSSEIHLSATEILANALVCWLCALACNNSLAPTSSSSNFVGLGLFIGISHSIIFALNLFRSNKNEISFEEIKSIKVRKRFNTKVLDIRLKNNRVRSVTGIQNSVELDDFINQNFEAD